MSSRQIGAILLVAGTTIGAGMLALPVTTGFSGFLPSLVLMVLIWLFMMLTAFYLLEVTLKMDRKSNLISMTRYTLGKKGEVIAWITYLLLLYSLLAAYIVGGAQVLIDFAPHFAYPKLWPIGISLFFGTFVYFGTKVTDGLNRILMGGLIASYIILIAIGCCHIEPTFLTHQNWRFTGASFSIVVTSFGYHIIIPTLVDYLDRDARKLKTAIFVGSFIALLVYILWQIVAMGVIPLEGPLSLTTAIEEGSQVTLLLKQVIGNPWIVVAARGFSFFAIVTSLLGVSLSLVDFLADGFKIKKTRGGSIVVLLLAFIPPLLFALFYSKGFIFALHYAGIFVIILLALLPAWMAWKCDCKAWGGRQLLRGAVLFSLILLTIEVFHL